MFTRSDLQNISSAVQARDALSQVRDRERFEVSAHTRAEGDRYKINSEEKLLPLVNQDGQVFLSPLLLKDRAISVPENVEQGSILEYRDEMTGEYYYGQVTKKNSNKNVEIKSLSKQEVDDEIGINSKTRVYSIGSDDVRHFEGSGILTSLMSMLDPSENIVFKLMTLLLIGNIFESESITDIFMAVYIRIVSLAVSIIAVVYISSLMFG